MNGRPNQGQRSTRPDTIWPEEWPRLSKKQKTSGDGWDEDKTRLPEARRKQSRIFFDVSSQDAEYLKVIDDDEREVLLSEEWTRITLFQILRITLPEGCKWVNGGPTQVKQTARSGQGGQRCHRKRRSHTGTKKRTDCKRILQGVTRRHRLP